MIMTYKQMRAAVGHPDPPVEALAFTDFVFGDKWCELPSFMDTDRVPRLHGQLFLLRCINANVHNRLLVATMFERMNGPGGVTVHYTCRDQGLYAVALRSGLTDWQFPRDIFIPDIPIEERNSAPDIAIHFAHTMGDKLKLLIDTTR